MDTTMALRAPELSQTFAGLTGLEELSLPEMMAIDGGGLWSYIWNGIVDFGHGIGDGFSWASIF